MFHATSFTSARPNTSIYSDDVRRTRKAWLTLPNNFLNAAILFVLSTAVGFNDLQADIVIHESGWSLAHDVSSADDTNVMDASSLDYNPVDGNFYYGERNGAGDVFRWNSDGSTDSVVNRNDWTAGLAIDPNTGDLYVSDDFGGTVEKSVFDPGTGAYTSTSTWVSGFGGGDDDTAGIAMVPDSYSGGLNDISAGDALNVDRDNSGNDSIFQWSRDVAENETEIYNNSLTTDSWDIAANPSQIVITDDASGDGTGAILELINDGSGGLTLDTLVDGVDARAVTFDPQTGEIVFGTTDGKLFRLDGSGSISEIVTGFEHLSVGGLAFSNDGSRLLVSSWNTNGGNIWEFSRSAIPEPGSAGLVGLMMAAFGIRRRSRPLA